MTGLFILFNLQILANPGSDIPNINPPDGTDNDSLLPVQKFL